MKIFFKAGIVNLNEKSHYGRTALHLVVNQSTLSCMTTYTISDQINTLNLLFVMGADPFVKQNARTDGVEETPREFAVRKKCPQDVITLLENTEKLHLEKGSALATTVTLSFNNAGSASQNDSVLLPPNITSQVLIQHRLHS